MQAQRNPTTRTELRPTRVLAFLIAFSLAISTALADDNRTKLKPGVDRYSPDQDVAIGHAAAIQLEHFLPMLKDARVNLYLSTLGHQLAAHAPGPTFAYEFHCVNSREINAFALPGGFVFVNRGTIEASHTESQLAAIIAHEIAHVALRHGTNQATKQEIWSAVGAASGIAGGLTGGAAGGIAGQLGGVFAANSVLLEIFAQRRNASRYSRYSDPHRLRLRSPGPRTIFRIARRRKSKTSHRIFRRSSQQ